MFLGGNELLNILRVKILFFLCGRWGRECLLHNAPAITDDDDKDNGNNSDNNDNINSNYKHRVSFVSGYFAYIAYFAYINSWL